MVNYELDFDKVILQRNPVTGRFNKNHTPFNKGRKRSEWMDSEKEKMVMNIGLKNLKRNYKIGGWNRKMVVLYVGGGKLKTFSSSVKAAQYLGIAARNVRRACAHGYRVKGLKVKYIDDI
jgi:hypothetical protein